MGRVRQGSGSGEGAAATPTPGTRVRQPRAEATAERGAQPNAPTAEAAAEMELEVLGSSPLPVENDPHEELDFTEPPPMPPRSANPEPLMALDASPRSHKPAAPKLPPKQQNFAGRYTTLARLRLDDGTIVAPNSEVQLNDTDARYYLAHKVVKAIAVRPERGGLKDLPADQDFSGRYRALARLKHDDDTKTTQPGEVVVLTDIEARHYLASGVVESDTGLQL